MHMSRRTVKSKMTPAPFFLFLAAWLCVATALASTSWFAHGALTAGLFIPVWIALALVMVRWQPALRAAVEATPTWGLILPHVARLFGALFFLEAGRGLNASWAFWAGWGDIATAVSCLPIAAIAARSAGISRRGTRAIWAWNVFGLIDIVAAPLSAVAIIHLAPDSLVAIRTVPLVIVPLFFVPLMVFLHVLLTQRLLREKAQASSTKSVRTMNYAVE